MKRVLNEIALLALLALALTGLFLVSRPREELVLISLASAFAVYGLLTRFGFRWTLPRRRRHEASITVCFLGALLVSFATRDPEGERLLASWVAALSGAFAFLFAAVKTGVPTHVGILVNTESVSAHWNGIVPDVARGARIAERMRDLALFYKSDFVNGNFGVWPEHFEVSQEGSVTWFVKGLPDTRVTILFSSKFDPFSEPGGAPSQFEAVVPHNGVGIAVAGPVVQPGRGSYSITIQKPGAAPHTFVVEGGGSQKKG